MLSSQPGDGDTETRGVQKEAVCLLHIALSVMVGV